MVVGAVIMVTAWSTVWAQGSTCNPELISSGGMGISTETPGGFHQFLSGGVLMRCRGESTEMEADSVAWFSDRQRMDFVGNVQFRDSTMTLDSDRASYYMRDERLESFGNVRLENEETGSMLVGSRLTYSRAVPGIRETTEIFAINRPTVEYRSETDSEADPYVIVADRIRLRGNHASWAGGDVTIDRENFSASGDSSLLDMGAGEGFLIGSAKMAGRGSASYTLVGQRIDFRMIDNSVNWIQSRDSAVAMSADWKMTGDTIEFELDDDMIQRGSAWGTSTRPQAVSAEQTITADSLIIETPDQILTEVRGIGNGHAMTHADSTKASDWIAGDTVVASFGEQDTGRGLTMLAALGSAQSFFHIFEDSTEVGLPAINYARGREITVLFHNGTLDRVDVVDGDGVYLEPPVRKPSP